MKPTRRQIAKAARLAVEEQAIRWNWPGLRLTGLCGIASYVLTFLFQRYGHPGKMIQGKYRDGCHCWVESKDSIWDITATQFGKNRPKVLIVRKAKAFGYKPEIEVTEDNLADAFRGWDDQTPDPSATAPIVEKALAILPDRTTKR